MRGCGTEKREYMKGAKGVECGRERRGVHVWSRIKRMRKDRRRGNGKEELKETKGGEGKLRYVGKGELIGKKKN